MELVFLLLLFPVTLSVKHSLTYYSTTSSGLQTFPEFVAVSEVDGVQVAYCDSNNITPEPRHVWVKQLFESEPQHLTWHVHACLGVYHRSKADTEDFKQHFNHTAGVHVFQEIASCELNSETGEVSGYQWFAYDGEEFISLDLKTLTWQFTERAAGFKQKWDRDKARLHFSNNFLTNICPQFLKDYLNYGSSFLQRKELPSVSLLQKTSSSPVTCHATGFYPDRADLVWMKDGVELHEDVDKGEILPNHDGTFQMSVDLKTSSIKPEDWNKYNCVFQLAGAEDKITELDKKSIRTNEGNPLAMIIPIGAAMVVLAVIAVVGFLVYKKIKKDKRPPSPVENRDVQEEMLPKA